MTVEEMQRALETLGRRLEGGGLRADIVMAGGAWMALVFGARQVTKDIDAYLAPLAEPVRRAVEDVASELGLPSDWLNDGIKDFLFTSPPQELWQQFGGLSVYAVTAGFMLALKVYAARTEDYADVQALIRYLHIGAVSEILAIVERYIPTRLLTAKHAYIAESCLEGGGT